MSDSKYELMRHALGVHSYRYLRSNGGTRWRKPHRNHFVSAVGGETEATWRVLVAEGLAKCTRENGGVLTDGCPVFAVTDAGTKAALAGIVFKRTWGYGTPENP